MNKTGYEDYTEKYKDPEYIRLRALDALRLVNQLKDLKIFKKRNKTLDVGCGTGEFGAAFQRNFGANVFGFDLNKLGVLKAKKNGLIARIGNIDRRWPYQNSFFDSILGVQIIEHLVETDHFLQESKRILKKNGILVLTTPNLAAWFNRIILLFGYQPFFTEVSTLDKTLGLSFTRNLTPNRKPLGHLRCFTLKSIKDILELHGFEIIKIKGSTVTYFPKYMYPLDKFFSYLPGLSTDLLIVARKK